MRRASRRRRSTRGLKTHVIKIGIATTGTRTGTAITKIKTAIGIIETGTGAADDVAVMTILTGVDLSSFARLL